MKIQARYDLYDLTECCNDFLKNLKEDDIFSLMDNIPFQNHKTEPIIYISSDGGNGGIMKIDYCPFCGNKIEIKNIEINIIDNN